MPRLKTEPKLYAVRTIEDLLASVAKYEETREPIEWEGTSELLVDMARRIQQLEQRTDHLPEAL